ncbi:hypothetical protein EYF80_057495 [Liparis tanakae]|uniref:Uncharacterized protein n=1 Tax=Liparis tanakae TaxID=230148 RepID=A0A4Z2ETW5_9TELE|nr:hypothetical protein EYF80_057495 [Liparis tanakae]
MICKLLERHVIHWEQQGRSQWSSSHFHNTPLNFLLSSLQMSWAKYNEPSVMGGASLIRPPP